MASGDFVVIRQLLCEHQSIEITLQSIALIFDSVHRLGKC